MLIRRQAKLNENIMKLAMHRRQVIQIKANYISDKENHLLRKTIWLSADEIVLYSHVGNLQCVQEQNMQVW